MAIFGFRFRSPSNVLVAMKHCPPDCDSRLEPEARTKQSAGMISSSCTFIISPTFSWSVLTVTVSKLLQSES